MLGRLYKSQDCSAARALEIVGERWSLLILRDAIFRGFTRFSDFQRSLGIATNVLSQRLDGFVRDGLMTDGAASGGSEKREYRLSDKGRALMPAIIALTEWGDEWIGHGPVTFRHRECEGQIRLLLHCDQCQNSVSPDAIDVRKTEQPGAA